jgi:hypothetical protein
MKPSGVVVSVVFAAIALALVVWVGRYQAEPPSLSGTKPAEVGPPISPTGPHPKAVAEETEFDFGVMPVYGKGKHEYVIRNEGEADLVLMARKEDTTCSCTFGELSKDGSIKPGESVKVTLQWEIKAMTEPMIRRTKPLNWWCPAASMRPCGCCPAAPGAWVNSARRNRT